MDNRNQLTNITRSGTFTVAGTATEQGGGSGPWGWRDGVTNLTVSGTGLSSGAADIYGDGSWARAGAVLANGTNTYTAVASDTYGRTDQNSVSVYLPATNNLSYDLNGNLTNDGLRTLEYDFENQLTNIFVSGGWRSEFKYDAFGRRRIRREYTWSGSAWVQTNEVRYVYDGLLVIQERDGNNLPLVTYTRGTDLSRTLQGAGGIGGLLARQDHSTFNPQLSTSYYHSDGNGNITCLIDTNGAVVARYHYDPYGNILSMSGPLAEANLYRFSSKEAHPNSGFVYYLYRYYAPELQRWVNQDAIAESGDINLYSFVFGDPVALIDAVGECPLANPMAAEAFARGSTGGIGKPFKPESLAQVGGFLGLSAVMGVGAVGTVFVPEGYYLAGALAYNYPTASEIGVGVGLYGLSKAIGNKGVPQPPKTLADRLRLLLSLGDKLVQNVPRSDAPARDGGWPDRSPVYRNQPSCSLF